jgi:hypothetical protein
VNPGWWASTAWIGPPPSAVASYADMRVWRWAAGEGPPVRGIDDVDEVVQELVAPPGWAQPGLCVLDAQGQPLSALGRHPRLHLRQQRQPSWVEQAVLVPTPTGWQVAAAARYGPTRSAIVDGSGAEVAVLDQPGFVRLHAIGKKDVLTVGGRPWSIGRDTFRAGAGIRGFSLVDPATKAEHAQVEVVADRSPHGDPMVPYRLACTTAPHIWELWALLVLVSTVIDAADPGHSEG